MDCFLILLGSLVALNFSIFAPVADAVKKFSTTDIYYQILNHEAPLPCDSIVMVDMTEVHSREDLAGLLLEIESQEPAVIGVDVCFEGLRLDEEGSAFLKEAVADSPDAVFAYRMEDYNPQKGTFEKIMHSYFAEDLEVDEGYVNTATQSGDIQRYTRPIHENDGQKHYSLSAAVVKKFKGENAATFLPNQLYPIDFTPTDFPVVKADEVSCSGDKLKGRIVLMGGVSNYDDMHVTPIGRMPGIKLIAYSVRTLMNNPQVENTSLLSASTLGQFAMGVLFVILHCAFFRWGERRTHASMRRLCTMSITFLFEVSIATALMLYYSFYMFVEYNVIIELKWAAAVIALTATSLQLCHFIQEFYNDFLRHKSQHTH